MPRAQRVPNLRTAGRKSAERVVIVSVTITHHRPMPGLHEELRHLVSDEADRRQSPEIGEFYFAPCGSACELLAIGPYEWCSWPVCPDCLALAGGEDAALGSRQGLPPGRTMTRRATLGSAPFSGPQTPLEVMKSGELGHSLLAPNVANRVQAEFADDLNTRSGLLA